MVARGLWSRGALLLLGGMLAACASTSGGDPRTTSRTLAKTEVDALLQGQGLGMAAVAEINGYPGPQHVLDLKDELGLTPDQRFATSRLIGVLQGQARSLGQRVVDAERRLDADMAEGSLSRDQVRTRLETLAALRAQLRFTHIEAHLQQKKILTPEQVVRYYELRGRDVILPVPVAPPSPTDALALPAKSAPAVVPAAPATPAVISVPALPAPDEPDNAPTRATPKAGAESAAPAVSPPPLVPSAPATLSPGVQDAMEEAEPMPAAPAPATDSAPEPVAPEAVFETAPPKLQPAPPTPVEKAAPVSRDRRLSPGMLDAMEEAEPMPVIEEVPAEEPPYIAPLESADDELEYQDAVERREPVTVDLDN